MCLLANNRSIVIKKADKGLCVIVQDHDDYLAEVSKQLNDASVCESAKFKDIIVQDLAKKTSSKVLSRKVKLLKKK